MLTSLARFLHHHRITPGLLAAAGLFSACDQPADRDDAEPDLFPITLQTDWFAQPEHGGFYQALAKGFYEEAGLEVKIVSGGPNAMTLQRVLRGRADFAMHRADFIFKQAAEGIPLKMVMSTLQKDPQAIMLHADNPVDAIEQLDGKAVMAVPGLTWITYVERKFGIELNILPHDFGMERFIHDPSFIQQCLETNEPFYAQQYGVDVKTLPLRKTGFNPYHGVYTLQSFAESHPAIVELFVAASIRGWKDFIDNDPQPAFALIAERNPRMNEDFMRFSYQTLVDGNYIRESGTAAVGELDPERMRALEAELIELQMVRPPEEPIEWYAKEAR